MFNTIKFPHVRIEMVVDGIRGSGLLCVDSSQSKGDREIQKISSDQIRCTSGSRPFIARATSTGSTLARKRSVRPSRKQKMWLV